MKLLAVETAFESCSVALLCEGDCRERLEPSPRGHAEHLLPFVEALLAEASLGLGDLDGIAFSRGPGSFTSLRIGIGVVQGLAFGADLPVWPVSSLRTVAQGVVERDGDGEECGAEFAPGVADRICVAMDARMNEVFSGHFRRESIEGIAVARAEGVERVGPAKDAVPVDPARWTGAGSGFRRFEDLARTPFGRIIDAAGPRAAVLARLAAREWEAGKALPAEEAQPLYVRDRVAEKPDRRPG